MKQRILLMAVGMAASVLAQEPTPAPGGEACTRLLGVRKLPVKLKTRGRVRRAQWEQTDQILTDLSADPGARGCRFRFEQLFRTDREELYFPVTNNLVRVAPENTLEGLPLYRQSGERAGEYSGRVTFTRQGGLYSTQSYTLYHFQYRDNEGELQSSGNHLLLDDYLVSWEALRERQAISVEPAAP